MHPASWSIVGKPDGTLFYRCGNSTPIAAEYDLMDLPVAGEMPRGLYGTLFRNGPNPQFDDGGESHWFLGDGMVHAFTLAEGRASYRNRWVRTHKWRAENAAGRPLLPGYPRPSLPGLAIPNTGVANTWRGLQSGRADHFAVPAGDGVSEAVFVLRGPDAAEGDGWLLAVAWRGAERRRDLIVLASTGTGWPMWLDVRSGGSRRRGAASPTAPCAAPARRAASA